MNKILVIGSGLTSSIIARNLVELIPNIHIEIWESRSEIGGNCFTEKDLETGIMIHKYGPHIFNTNNLEIWNYINKFGKFRPFYNRVKAVTEKGVFSLPINLLTINQFFNLSFDPSSAKNYIESLIIKNDNPKNFEELALSKIGYELYENFIKYYTIKQWGCNPLELPTSVFNRLPIRFDYNDHFYDKIYVGIPEHGYANLINNILDHPNIQIFTKRKFTLRDYNEDNFDHYIFTGCIDEFYDYKFGMLGYRTVFFEKINTNVSDYQGNAVVNYTSNNVPWTRIHEHKHFTPWLKFEKTIAFKEFSKETLKSEIPFYPKNLEIDKILFQKYKEYIKNYSKKNISFLGRLATYRYLNMDEVVLDSLNFSKIFHSCLVNNKHIPFFIE